MISLQTLPEPAQPDPGNSVTIAMGTDLIDLARANCSPPPPVRRGNAGEGTLRVLAADPNVATVTPTAQSDAAIAAGHGWPESRRER